MNFTRSIDLRSSVNSTTTTHATIRIWSRMVDHGSETDRRDGKPVGQPHQTRADRFRSSRRYGHDA